MNTNKKNTIFLINISIIPLISSILFIFIDYSHFFKRSVSISCMSHYSAPLLPGNISIRSNITIDLRKNNTGSLYISGVLEKKQGDTDQNKTSSAILREIEFDYSIEDNGFISIYNTEVYHLASDKISDDFFNSNVFDLSLPNRKIKIKKINNSWLLSTPFSPIMMCVNKN